MTPLYATQAWHGPRFDPSDPLVSNDYSGWWKRSFGVVRRGWRLLLRLQLIGAAPLALAFIPFAVWSDRFNAHLERAAHTGGMPNFAEMMSDLLWMVPLGLVGWLLSFAVYLASSRAVLSIAAGRPTSVRVELAASVRRLPALIGWSLLSFFITAIGFLFCFLPGLYASAVFSVLVAVVAFERTNAISRCFQLFHADLGAALGRIATTWGIAIAISIPFSVMSLVVSVVAAPAGIGTFSVGGSVVGGVFSLLGTIATGLVFIPMLVATYADLRARREGALTTAHLAAETYG